ncbi:unnamed protein product, partial [Ectocarpus fasciculatus]
TWSSRIDQSSVFGSWRRWQGCLTSLTFRCSFCMRRWDGGVVGPKSGKFTSLRSTTRCSTCGSWSR